jgi:hypothetical protein
MKPAAPPNAPPPGTRLSAGPACFVGIKAVITPPAHAPTSVKVFSRFCGSM